MRMMMMNTQAVNEVYKEFFTQDFPARAAIQVCLNIFFFILVEISLQLPPCTWWAGFGGVSKRSRGFVEGVFLNSLGAKGAEDIVPTNFSPAIWKKSDDDLYIIGAVSISVTKKWPPLLFVLPRWLVRFIYNRSCLSVQIGLPPVATSHPPCTCHKLIMTTMNIDCQADNGRLWSAIICYVTK